MLFAPCLPQTNFLKQSPRPNSAKICLHRTPQPLSVGAGTSLTLLKPCLKSSYFFPHVHSINNLLQFHFWTRVNYCSHPGHKKLQLAHASSHKDFWQVNGKDSKFNKPPLATLAFLNAGKGATESFPNQLPNKQK